MFFRSRRQTVLIIDASKEEAVALREALQTRQYMTAAFSSISEARYWLAEHQPNAVVLYSENCEPEDVQALRELKAFSGTLHPLIFVISAKSCTLEQARAMMAKGADDIAPSPLNLDLFFARFEVHLHYQRVMVQLQRRNELLSRLAAFDELTHLFNRRSFLEAITNCLEHSEQQTNPLALLLIDVDHFKQVNDNYGHHTGDEVLRQLATHLASPLRQQDVIGRYGGEEFCALVQDLTFEQACGVAERLRQSVEQTEMVAGDQHLKITVSIGVAWVPGRLSIPVDRLLQCSDSALYVAKRTGRNRVIVHRLDLTPSGALNCIPGTPASDPSETQPLRQI